MCLCREGYRCCTHSTQVKMEEVKPSLEYQITCAEKHLKDLKTKLRLEIRRDRLREKALKKLTEEEKAVLGL